MRLRTVHRHHASRGERTRIRRGAGSLHADDLGAQAEQIARQDRAADAGAKTDRHIQRIERRCSTEQLQRIGGDALDQIGCKRRREFQTLGRGNPRRCVARHLEIVAMLEQSRAECPHRGILFHAVAMRHDDGHWHVVASAGPGQRLTMIAARGGHDTWYMRPFTPQAFRVDQAAAQFERADRRVVLMLHPHLCATALRQQRPRILRRAREAFVHHRQRVFEFRQREHALFPGPLLSIAYTTSR